MEACTSHAANCGLGASGRFPRQLHQSASQPHRRPLRCHCQAFGEGERRIGGVATVDADVEAATLVAREPDGSGRPLVKNFGHFPKAQGEFN